VVTRTGADLGKLLECAVYLSLRRHGLTIAYWRGKGEVDFVLTTRDGFVPMQVSWEAPSGRHHAALEEFYEALPQAGEALFVGPSEHEAGILDRLEPSVN